MTRELSSLYLKIISNSWQESKRLSTRHCVHIPSLTNQGHNPQFAMAANDRGPFSLDISSYSSADCWAGMWFGDGMLAKQDRGSGFHPLHRTHRKTAGETKTERIATQSAEANNLSQHLSHRADSLDKGRHGGGQRQKHLPWGHSAGRRGSEHSQDPGNPPTVAASCHRLGKPLSSRLR